MFLAFLAEYIQLSRPGRYTFFYHRWIVSICLSQGEQAHEGMKDNYSLPGRWADEASKLAYITWHNSQGGQASEWGTRDNNIDTIFRIFPNPKMTPRSSSPEFFSLAIGTDLAPLPIYKAATTSSVNFTGLLEPPLKLHEDLSKGCGGQLWPAGMVLAQHMLRYHKDSLRNSRM